MKLGHWEFDKSRPSSVRIDPTQRDQFNNDDVGLADALVREVIQNSSDAGLGTGPVKVRFSVRSVEGRDVEAMREHLKPLMPHLQACDFDCSIIDADEVRILAIEDFNTTGLTGRFDQTDGGNFDSFWRVFGKSEKKGSSGGRWGLGKLVFSSASMIRAFYGLTFREGDPGPSIMGQAVLQNHVIDSDYFPAHGFWFGKRSDNDLDLQLPVANPNEIAGFSGLAGLTRTNQSGLSIVIPWLSPGIDEETIISGVISNYYFPILSGKLEVEVGKTAINAQTFLEVADQSQKATDSHIPFDFVKEISDAMRTEPEFTARKEVGKTELQEDHFSEEDFEALKSRFAEGRLVSVRVPVFLRPKDAPDTRSYIDLFLKSLPEGHRPYALFSRGPITLPKEKRHFAGSMALGALIANDSPVATFLGDAENPAHTGWNPKAEKLKPNWRMPLETLTTIRHSLKLLYELIADQTETEDTEALIDFFSILDRSQSSSGRKKKSPKPKVDIPPREKAIIINPRKGGFDITAGPGAKSWEFPRTIRVRVAYDMIGANPFTRHSPFDFDLRKDGTIQVAPNNARVKPVSSNILAVVVSSPDFHLAMNGFDEKRDLVVDARALG